MFWWDYLFAAIAVAGAVYSVWGIFQSIKERDFGLDVLALIAIIATFVEGEFLASAVVVVMTLTGDFLEDFAGRKAKFEITRLVSATPNIAHRLVVDTHGQNGGQTAEDIAISEVRIGDKLRVLAGEVVPVDGKLLTAGVFDESSLTGESLPVEKSVGEEVFSGAFATGSSIEIEALQLATDSQYQKIVNLVEDAALNKSRAVRLASQISIPFTIVSLLIAGVAWAISGESLRFAEVLVLATPCPLLIAAPVAFIGGISRAAKRGVIVKSGVVFEKLNRAQVFAFDKTGTLTSGKPEVVRADNEALRLAALLEQHSNHVFAKAIVFEAHSRGFESDSEFQVQEISGRGLLANVDGATVKVGSLGFAAPERYHKATEEDGEFTLPAGASAVYVSRNGELIGRIELSDAVRPSASNTISELRALGVKHIAMLTGDKRETGKMIGAEVGIHDVRSELLPQQKLEAVEGMKHTCRAATESSFGKLLHHSEEAECPKQTVVFVGDGVNDAPVIASADVGIAVAARGESSASGVADAVLLRDDISGVADLMRISKQTVAIAKESMIGGISLSIALMLVAAWGFIPAVAGAGLQELIDVIAICNGVRAAFKK